MLPFSAASEPGEMLDEASQWKVFQCVAVNFLGLVPVQMHVLFAVLLRVWWMPLSEVPSRRICVLWCSKPGWDLNHGRSCRNSCNTFVVSGLAAGFRLVVRFRCYPFPPHLNQRMCLLKPCNEKFLNELW